MSRVGDQSSNSEAGKTCFIQGENIQVYICNQFNTCMCSRKEHRDSHVVMAPSSERPRTPRISRVLGEYTCVATSSWTTTYGVHISRQPVVSSHRRHVEEVCHTKARVGISKTVFTSRGAQGWRTMQQRRGCLGVWVSLRVRGSVPGLGITPTRGWEMSSLDRELRCYLQ